MIKKDPQKAAQKHEKKGDEYFKKKKYEQALKSYENSLSYNSKNPEIYDKLIESHNLVANNWTIEDFTKDLSWTMQKQELDNPTIANLHEKLSPEFNDITELIIQFVQSSDEEMESKHMELIMQYGELAVLPLLEFLRTLKTREEDQSESS